MVLQWGDHGLIYLKNQSIKQAGFLLFKRDILILNISILFLFSLFFFLFGEDKDRGATLELLKRSS